jgi:acetyl esterase/lipase
MARKIYLIGGSVVGAIVLLIAVIWIVDTITPIPLTRTLQHSMVSGEVNSFLPKTEPNKTKLSKGTLLYGDIQYGEKYPNSYLDIYIPDGDIHTRRPTFFFVHGGGYAWGDKFEGDPIAEGNGDSKSPTIY